MNELDPLATLPPPLRHLVNETCDQFEAALRSGQPARAEDYLVGPEPVLGPLLGELLTIECDHRLRSGETVTELELTTRFPGREAIAHNALRHARSYAEAPDGLFFPDGSPAVIGQYRLLRELGRGGFGIVFLAASLDADQRMVAIKVPHTAALFDAAFRNSFLREARAAQALDHPHIVRVVEADVCGPVCYLVMEYVRGQNLADWLAAREGRPASPAETAALVAALADAVHHAHERGVLHCDLTPANILLADGDLGRPKLTDFGLARLAQPADLMSPTGPLIGTPAYMAPEQAGADRRAITPRTDVYGLGAVLYHLLTGRPPVVAGSLAQALDQVVRGHPPRPRSLRPALTEELEAICLHCLEKNPDDRYAAAHDLADDLRNALAGRPTLARPLGTLGRFRFWRMQNPRAAAWLGAGLALTLVTVTFLAWHLIQLRAMNRDLTLALDERDRAGHSLRAERDLSLTHEAELRRRVYPIDLRRAAVRLAQHDLDGYRAALATAVPRLGEEDLRGFEWHHLDHLGRPSPHRVGFRSEGPVYAVAVRPDRQLAAVGVGPVLHLIDPVTGEARHAAIPHPKDVNRIVFAPNGRSFATACDDGVVRFWPNAGAPPREYRGHVGKVKDLALTPDGRIVSAGEDQTVRVWPTVRPTSGGRTLATTRATLRAVACSPDGRVVATGEESGLARVKLWDIETGRQLAELHEDSTQTCGLAFGSSSRIVIAGRSGVVAVYECEHLTGLGPWRRVLQVGAETDRINDMGVSRDGSRVAITREGVVEIWRVATGELEATFRGHQGRIWAAAFDPDGERVWSGGADGIVRVFDLQAPQPLSRCRVRGDAQLLGFDPAGRHLAVAADVSLRFLNLQSGQLSATTSQTLPRAVLRGAFARSGELHLIADNGDLLRYGTERLLGRKQTKLGDGTGRVFGPSGVAIAPNARWGLAWYWPKFHVCGAAGEPLPSIEVTQAVGSVAIAGEGSIAATCHDRMVRLWSAETGRPIATLSCERESPKAVAISRDGQRVAAACGATVLIWDVSNATPQTRLAAHRGPVHAIAFAPDGRTVATGGEDGTVRLWRADTGQEVVAYTEHEGPVTRLVFSDDGQYLASSGPSTTFAGETVIYVRQGGHSEHRE